MCMIPLQAPILHEEDGECKTTVIIFCTKSILYTSKIYILVNVPRRVHYGIYCTRGGSRGKYSTRRSRVLYLPRDPAPSAINPVVHETCGTLTGLLCDVTEFSTRLVAAIALVASYGSCAARVVSEALSGYQPQFDETRME